MQVLGVVSGSVIVVGWVLAGLGALLCAYWLATLITIRAGMRSMPPLERWQAPSEQDPSVWPRVSIIVPAHNEERVIDEALTSLRASAYSDFEVIVAADRCTDQTADIVERHGREDSRIRLVRVSECPPSWSGKCHAAWSGYRAATGHYLLFTDADTLFAPLLLKSSIRCMRDRKLDLLSLLGTLRSEKEFERTAQPVAAMALMRVFPIHRANRGEGKRRRPFANGQFLLFDRGAYERFGTHERIRHAILEDLVFALRMNSEGFRLALALAPELFFVRMYETEEAFVRGWKRILIEAMNREIPRLRRAAMRLRFLALTPLFLTAAVSIGCWIATVDAALGSCVAGTAAAAALLQSAALIWIYSIQRMRLSDLTRFPLGAWQVGSLLSAAADDLKHERGIQWARLHYAVRAAGDESVKRRPVDGVVSRDMRSDQA